MVPFYYAEIILTRQDKGIASIYLFFTAHFGISDITTVS